MIAVHLQGHDEHVESYLNPAFIVGIEWHNCYIGERSQIREACQREIKKTGACHFMSEIEIYRAIGGNRVVVASEDPEYLAGEIERSQIPSSPSALQVVG